MHDHDPVAYRHAETLVSSFVALGLKHVVISPGSRSTPLVLAIHRFKELEKHVVLDERSAAFIALGIGRSTGYPAALVCTSGTAVANYYPAVIEARQSQIPLVVISADRSNLDRSNGAPQSMIQAHLFGTYPVFEYDIILPDTPESLLRLDYLAWQSIDAAVHKSGPVHLNMAFDKPFEPHPNSWEPSVPLASHSARWIHKPAPGKIEPEHLGIDLTRFKRPVVVAGPLLGDRSITDHWISLLQDSGIPVIAELSSGLSHSKLIAERIRPFTQILSDPKRKESLKPDLILRIGHFPSGKVLEHYLETHRNVTEIAFHDVLSSGSPQHSAGTRVNGVPSARFIQLVKDSIETGWLNEWQSAAAQVSTHYGDEILTDGAVHRAVTHYLPKGTNLFLSNSLPIRDFNFFNADWNTDHNPIFTARGVSGIDGISSQALGVSLGSNINTVLITGDLAFFHDSNLLMSKALLKKSSLTIVVINNGGGQIFRSLPVASFESVYETYFGTPQDVDIELLCRAHGVEYQKVTTPAELSTILNIPHSDPGIRVIECVTDTQASVWERKASWKS
jgi:2-succinyl-5-enolpyruvyl-6-hydroxy-3-cyclohexene-1-carboxylate synthase